MKILDNILTGLVWPCSSVVDPTLGGSTITSYMIPVKYAYVKLNIDKTNVEL